MHRPAEQAANHHAAALDARIVRYGDLVPCRNAFIDTRTPGSEAKENFTIIGPGVSENPDQHIHIAEPHGFNIGGARQPPHCVNSQHSHDTAEVFVVHSGRWRFTFGEDAGDGMVEGRPGDIVSFPTHVFRGFENIGDDAGFLWSVLGGDDPGRVLWAPRVFDMAKDYGLVLLDDGSLVDTAAGQSVPAGATPMPVTTPAQVAALDRIDSAQAERLVVRDDDSAGERNIAPGVRSRRVIGDDGDFDWPHGFTVDRLSFDADSVMHAGRRDAPHVIFVQEGMIDIVIDEARRRLSAGDTITIPQGVERVFRADRETTLFSVERASA